MDANVDFDTQPINLPSTWFESRITFEQIRRCFMKGKEEIRIASGFFTIRGWGLIRKSTTGKQVYLLVGIEDPGEDRARKALVNEIMRDLRTGLDHSRRQAVFDLVQKMAAGEFHIFDARAMNHHAKLYLIDRKVAIITSANTTGRGFIEQIESGTLETKRDKVIALVDKFDEYFAQAKDITQELLEAFQRWLELADPWDIYLKTILALENLQPIKANYKKQPVSYQVDMISQTLNKIRDHGGSMLVASTGLGKTVVAVHVAIHLREEGLIDKVIVVCPVAVRNIWKREMRDASLHSDYFTLSALDKENSTHDHTLNDFEEIVQNMGSDGRYFLIFDESHQLRKRYSDEFSNRRYRKEDRTERLAFTRLRSLVQSGNLKVLLLSGSPYATDIDNINTQLLLLPHTAESNVLLPEFIDDARAWRIDEAEYFTTLPVASQLTTPHVAKYYGQTDSQGIYIDFGGQKKYIPQVILHSIYVPLPNERELTSIIVDGYFDLNTPHPIYRKNIETQVKISWGSSPEALLSLLERVVDTPGGLKEFDFAKKGTSTFKFSKTERQQVLNPIIKKLKELTFEHDLKLQTLVRILKELHAKKEKEKVIVFCERLPTAVYLEQGLAKLMPELRVFSTIVSGQSQKIDNYEPKKTKDIEEAIAKFAPHANNAIGNYKETYDVFIATDAYGIGVSMQDASVVVNYDIAWTPIEPVQRAGRILRFWHLPRTVQLYTFIPTLSGNTNLGYELLNIRQRWENLMERHGESRKLIDLPVLTTSTMQEIYMPDVAPQKVMIESGNLKLDRADDQDVSPFYKHTAQLQLNRDYAENINSDIISAKTYPGQNPLIYVLLKYNGKYNWSVYNPKLKQLVLLTDVQLLDLIACCENTSSALVDPDEVEALSDICIRAWCAKHGISEQEVIRECALYLKPESEKDTASSLLNIL
ncbi:DEAD/DEAH box helicase family protein [Nostoc sp. FACHB-892]|uniref:helicase-related protein n=1 Tax=Nostoc sp. FACHB-892 TaxID=2692843 RepID=UPI001685CB9E|nr:helicase-related protein [Nostoc sp. FACHB-892]MBD2732243.1 DEAD/DEAH box helicase family protein [Nostoc sp. FACHB-892]